MHHGRLQFSDSTAANRAFLLLHFTTFNFLILHCVKYLKRIGVDLTEIVGDAWRDLL